LYVAAALLVCQRVPRNVVGLKRLQTDLSDYKDCSRHQATACQSQKRAMKAREGWPYLKPVSRTGSVAVLLCFSNPFATDFGPKDRSATPIRVPDLKMMSFSSI
jgi:hypothetical protein